MIIHWPKKNRVRHNVVARVLRAWAICLFALVSGNDRIQAQIPSPPQPAVLTDIAVSNTGEDESQITLTFSPLAPKYTIIADGTDKPSISFALSTRGLGATFPATLHGLLRSIAIEQSETILVLHFTAASAVSLTATPVGNKVITVKFSKEASAAPSMPLMSLRGPLPKQLNRAPSQDGFEVVPLKYADISEVVGLLTDGQTVKSNDAFIPHDPAFGAAGTGGQPNFTPGAQPSTQSPDDPLAESVNDAIGVDRRLNAIILKGMPDRIARMKEKIAEIDVPVQSVILETTFVELDQSGAKNLGLDFANANNQIGVANFDTGAFIPSGFATNRGLSSAALQAALYAQVQAGRGRIVSQPRIAAQSGATAKIITGNAIPIQTAITLSGVNGVSQQVQYVNVGVTLQIAPRVSSDGFVTTHVYCVVSSVTGSSGGYPTISQREAQTSATVHDGETFVIGGLTEDDLQKSTSEIPGAGDVPLLGELFKLHQDTNSKTELFIVMTPHIVIRGEELPAAVKTAQADAP